MVSLWHDLIHTTGNGGPQRKPSILIITSMIIIPIYSTTTLVIINKIISNTINIIQLSTQHHPGKSQISWYRILYNMTKFSLRCVYHLHHHNFCQQIKLGLMDTRMVLLNQRHNRLNQLWHLLHFRPSKCHRHWDR